MIKKLRIKLIAASMLSLFLVLLIIMGTVNILNYREILTDADNTLSILKDNDGTFPKRESFHVPEEHGQKPMSPELPYESRYFSVVLSDSGNVVSVDTGKIAAVNTNTAAEFAQSVFLSGRERGFMENYRYVRHDKGDQVQIIFLDCGRDLSTFRSFLFASGIISLLGLLAVFGLILLLSKRIVRPVLESYEKQKQFITDAGHEIKTPITIIDADAEVLEMELGENEWLRDIQSQTRRLASLTNDLILLSKMEEDKPPLTIIEFPFSDLVSETAQSFQALAKAQNKTFTADIKPLISLLGDQKALRQLISILLDNALKYSGNQGRIHLSLQKQKKAVCLTVENTTDSPLPQRLDDLFERFYRADASRNSQTGGHGLGLSIAKAITEFHKGEIHAFCPEQGILKIQVLLPAGNPIYGRL